MTNEEAINLIDNLKGMIEDNQNNDYDGAFKLAIEALEKQIPKKPNIVINKIKYYNCGSCGSNVRFEDEYRYLHYCGICGQAIDWSEEDDSERID